MQDEAQSKSTKNVKSKRIDELGQYLSNLPQDYVVRVNNADIEINKTWLNVKDVELKITKAGIQIQNAVLDDCITSW